MGIPPHAARLVGTWTAQSAPSLQSPSTGLAPSGPRPSSTARQTRRDRSRRRLTTMLQPARWAWRTSSSAAASSRPA